MDTDERTIRELLADQHPDLAELALSQVVGGWDNRIWRLGEELAVRLPRRMGAWASLGTEQRWLPELALRLPLPVPRPVRTGVPSERFPMAWSVTTWVHGEPGDRARIERGGPVALAGFLAALHIPAPADARTKPNLAGATPEFERKVDRFGGELADELRAVWDAAVAAPTWTGPPVWLHGDLHPANVVVADGELAGVIDFGDLGAGDPATDLASAWLLLPAGADAEFLARYGKADAAMVARARGWAALRALSLIAIGRAGERGRPGGQPTWLAPGLAALRRLIAP